MYSMAFSSSDEDAIMIMIDCNAIRMLELAWLVASLAELGHERAAIIIIIAREYLHSMVVAIDDEQETATRIEHQASRSLEHAISTAWSLEADRAEFTYIVLRHALVLRRYSTAVIRELDSSVISHCLLVANNGNGTRERERHRDT